MSKVYMMVTITNRQLRNQFQDLFDKIKMDYFAVSLPDLLIWEDNLTVRNIIHCKYMMALGYWGLNQKEKSARLLKEVEKLDINHQGIQAFRSLIK